MTIEFTHEELLALLQHLNMVPRRAMPMPELYEKIWGAYVQSTWAKQLIQEINRLQKENVA